MRGLCSTAWMLDNKWLPAKQFLGANYLLIKQFDAAIPGFRQIIYLDAWHEKAFCGLSIGYPGFGSISLVRTQHAKLIELRSPSARKLLSRIESK